MKTRQIRLGMYVRRHRQLQRLREAASMGSGVRWYSTKLFPIMLLTYSTELFLIK